MDILSQNTVKNYFLFLDIISMLNRYPGFMSLARSLEKGLGLNRGRHLNEAILINAS